MADRIVVDLCTPHARAAAALLHLLSGGGIAFRRSWLIRDGEPVWHLEADRG